MKNLSLFVSAFALCASTSYAAINCSTLPTCSSLGYTDTVTQCPKSSTGAEMIVKCPFDTTQGKCIREAAVGQIAYFTKAPNAASGWLKCDGATFTKNKYPELYAFIGQQFCNAYNGGTCGTDVGRLPKYTGLFLRVSGTPTGYGKVGNSDLVTPQKEGLPNITGQLGPLDDGIVAAGYNPVATGPFSAVAAYRYDAKSSGDGEYDTNATGSRLSFNAGKEEPIYGRSYGTAGSNGVTPPNMAVYAYIYAGKIVQ